MIRKEQVVRQASASFSFEFDGFLAGKRGVRVSAMAETVKIEVARCGKGESRVLRSREVRIKGRVFSFDDEEERLIQGN